MSLTNATVINNFSELGFNWALMAPVLVVLFGAIIGILLEAFVPAKQRWSVQCTWSIAVVAVALLAFAPSFGAFDLQSGQRLVRGELIVDGFSMFSQLLMLIVGLLALLPMIDRTGNRVSAFAGQPSDIPGSFQEEQTERRGYQRSEVLPL
ncbi:MAG: NADH-quinone oxidoreductase subunit N, partial [Varibaculum cambriense]|nr:NADH-quinone oxidoreductase subunit N [Varibaculum cambriense]